MRHRNSYDFVRLIAASLVIVSHSYALLKLHEPQVGSVSLGYFAVSVFFTLSGFLIAMSWKQYPRFNVFIYKRVVRIFPGLIVAILSTIVILGFFSELRYADYIIHPQSLTYLNNILLINTQFSLPGVFQANPYVGVVNGSLWTLAFEFVAYVLLAVFGGFGLLKGRFVLKFWLVLLTLNIVNLLPGQSIFNFRLFYLDMRLFLPLVLAFFSGVLLQIHDKKIVYRMRIWLAALIVFFFLANIFPRSTPLIEATLLAYAVIGVGKIHWFSWIGKYGDFSYGLYIYAFPIQQAIIQITDTTNPIKLMVASFVITLIFAVLSWHLVERRFIRLKERVNPKSYPITREYKQLQKAW